MPLNTIQTYVQGLLNNLVIPKQSADTTLQAFITPPVLQPLDGPIAHVWGGVMHEERSTMPRGAGFKKLDWTVDVYLYYETTADDVLLDQAFPLVIDTVMQTLRTTTMPIKVTDPTTGQQSQVLSIGEQFDLEYPPERVPETLRMVLYVARIGVHLREDLQA